MVRVITENTVIKPGKLNITMATDRNWNEYCGKEYCVEIY